MESLQRVVMMRYSNSLDIVVAQLSEIQQRVNCDLTTAAIINQSIALANIANELIEVTKVLWVFYENNESSASFSKIAEQIKHVYADATRECDEIASG